MMAVDQLSVEEFLKKCPIDNHIQESLVLSSILSGQNYSPPATTSCVPYNGYPLIGMKENKFELFNLFFIFRSTKL